MSEPKKKKNLWGSEKAARKRNGRQIYAVPGVPGPLRPFLVALLMRLLWMWGITPPPAMVARMRVSSSYCRGEFPENDC